VSSFWVFKSPRIFAKIGSYHIDLDQRGATLVVLEAYAAGLPVVTTDVGSCSELVYGRIPEDQSLGASGRVVPIADPEAMAGAALELLWIPTNGIRPTRSHSARGAVLYGKADV